jgi:Na+/pantothenate symporter
MVALIGYSSIGASNFFLGEINMNKLVLAAAVVAAGFSGSSVFAEGK